MYHTQMRQKSLKMGNLPSSLESKLNTNLAPPLPRPTVSQVAAQLHSHAALSSQAHPSPDSKSDNNPTHRGASS